MYTEITSNKPTRWWDWPAALLLIAAILTAATRLNATNWTEHLTLIQTVAFLGVIAGLALGKSIFSPTISLLFATVYGLFTIAWRIGLTLGEGILWQERMLSISNRLLFTLDHIVQQRPVTDNMFFLTLMAILFWSLSAYAGYSLTRHGNPWRAIIPTGLALVIIQAYDPFFPRRGWLLAGYIFLALMLVARMNYLVQQKRWKENGTYLPPFASLDSIRLALLTTAVLILFAWTIPALASTFAPAESVWQRASQPWVAVRDRLGNAFSSLQASVGVVTDFYGDTLSLGRGNPLSDNVIMTVLAPPTAEAGVRYYWRARVYDYYDGDWSSTLPSVINVLPDQPGLLFPEYTSRSLADFTIQTQYPIQNLSTPSQPLWVSRPAHASVAVNPDATIDLAVFKANPPLHGGDIYQVKSSLTAASIEDLRQAGTDYPQWILHRYLQVPDSVTLRTRELAELISADEDNPYDIAQAVTDYLRNNISYSDTVPLVPAGQDPVDWILFDQGQAFCNYYATSEVIMLRLLGIPARMAVGYAQGERTSLEEIGVVPTPGQGDNLPDESDLQGDLYTVRHRDAHAWPEVYFPTVGWVEFEPTVSQLPILRPERDNPNPETDPETANQNNTPENLDRAGLDQLLAERANSAAAAEQGFQIPTAAWVLTLSGALVLAGIYARRYRQQRGLPPVPVQLESGLRRIGLQPPSLLRRWARLASLSPLARAYRELNRALARLGKPAASTDTPAERASHLAGLLPEASDPIQTLLVEYQLVTYGSQSANLANAQDAGREIRRASFLARFRQILARFQEPTRNRRSGLHS
jgi:transglutaminase-like putative cysteine protease